MIEKFKRNYPFDDDDLWDLKYDLSEYILPRLQGFCQKWKDGKMAAIPIWVLKEDKLSEAEYKEKWIEILEKMIYGFQGILAYRYNLNEYESLDKQQIEEGLLLFGQYFEHLWD